jgi:hypothetical protein
MNDDRTLGRRGYLGPPGTRKRSRRPAKKVRSTTATARWCGIRPPGSTAGPGCSSSRSATAARAYRLLTFASSTRGWCELHEEAFRRLGGTVQVVVLDNLREGVLKADIYDPALNPLYRDVLAHYGVVALPCRVGDPDRKGKVESAIGHTQAALKGLRFETLEAAQAYLDRWDARWADTRIHGTTKRQVAAMLAEERPSLRPLPVEPFLGSWAQGPRRVFAR